MSGEGQPHARDLEAEMRRKEREEGQGQGPHVGEWQE